MFIRKFVTTCEDILGEQSVPTGRVVRKAVSSAVITNPFSGKAQRDLADTLRLSRSGLTRRMEGVLRKKIVARVQSDGDKRVAYAVMTDKGMDLLRKVAPHHVDSVRHHMIDRLSDTEIRSLATAFEKIAKGLNEAH